MKKKLITEVVLYVAVVSQFCCQKNSVSPTIPSGEVPGNCIGTVKDTAGNTVAGATVIIVPDGYNPLQNGSDVRPDSTKTDAWGRFGFTVGQNGTFNLFASHDKQYALNPSVRIESDARTVSDAVVNSPGSLSGTVILEGETDHRSAVILFLGTNLYTEPSDMNGTFSVATLAEGTYAIRVLSMEVGFAVVETTVTVLSSAHTALPEIRLDADFDITIDSLEVVYDPLQMMSTLRWNPVNTAFIDGYAIYLNRETNLSPVVEVGNSETSVQLDVLAAASDTLTYQVAAIGRDGKPGPAAIGNQFVKKCGLTRCRTVPYRKFHMYYRPMVSIDTCGNFYVAYEHITGKIDSTGKPIGSYNGDFFKGFDRYGNAYFSNYSNDTLWLARADRHLQPVDSFIYYAKTGMIRNEGHIVSSWKGTVSVVGSVFDEENQISEYVITEYDTGLSLIREYRLSEKMYIEYNSFSFSKRRTVDDDFYIDSIGRNLRNSDGIEFLDDFVPYLPDDEYGYNKYERDYGFILGPNGIGAVTCILRLSPSISYEDMVDLVILFTLEGRLLARIPLQKCIADFFFDHQGNLYQSIFTPGSETDTIVQYPTAGLSATGIP
ncbi:MAG: hypothetical protein JW913_03685 [Chitinispirillaceae bacterium]|nr:hypothetical protein [Chitinispirillaceae bacterium]